MTPTEVALKEIDEKNKEKAVLLEHVADGLKQYCKVLRGEEQDPTGFGLWNIIKTNLEHNNESQDYPSALIMNNKLEKLFILTIIIVVVISIYALFGK